MGNFISFTPSCVLHQQKTYIQNILFPLILRNFQEEIFVVFESSTGISSKSKFLKYFENILIIYRDSGYLKLILYFWHNFSKVLFYFGSKISKLYHTYMGKFKKTRT